MERTEFLAGVLVAAIEHYGYGFPGIVEYEGDFDSPEALYAVIVDRYDDGKQYRVDLDTIAVGIGVIQRAEMRELPSGERVLHNTSTGERLYLHPDDRKLILEQSRENDGGEIDVVLALAILECALFGQVVYT